MDAELLGMVGFSGRPLEAAAVAPDQGAPPVTVAQAACTAPPVQPTQDVVQRGKNDDNDMEM